jgi:hypothetical protein
MGGGFTGNFSGSLKANGTSVGSLAVIDGSTGLFQNLTFDSPQFTTAVPDPLASLARSASPAWALLV